MKRGRLVAFATLLTLCPTLAPGQTAAPGGPAFTAAQAERGEAAYQHWCRACHGDSLDDGDFGGAPLKGAWFRDHWGAGNVAALFAYTKARMPPDNPGGLNDTLFADIVAFILLRNGYAPGASELPVDAQAQRGMSLRK